MVYLERVLKTTHGVSVASEERTGKVEYVEGLKRVLRYCTMFSETFRIAPRCMLNNQSLGKPRILRGRKYVHPVLRRLKSDIET